MLGKWKCPECGSKKVRTFRDKILCKNEECMAKSWKPFSGQWNNLNRKGDKMYKCSMCGSINVIIDDIYFRCENCRNAWVV